MAKMKLRIVEASDLEGFREALVAEDLSPATVRGYVGDVGLFIRWYEGAYGEAFEAGRICRREVQAYRAYLQAANAKGSTINRRLASLAKFFAYDVQGADGVGVKGIRVIDPGVQSLSGQELRRVLREVHKAGVARDVAILELLSNTGMRVGELVSLRVGDVVIRERSGSVEIRQGKGRSSRIVPLNVDARREVSAWMEERGNRQDAKGTPMGSEGFLFVGERGPLTAGGVWKIVRRYGDLAGIPALRVHQLRHTALTRLLEEGVDIGAVASIAGHSDLRTTLRYTRRSTAGMAAAVEKLAIGGE